MARRQFRQPLKGPTFIRKNRQIQIRDILNMLDIRSNSDDLFRFGKCTEIPRLSAATMPHTDTNDQIRLKGTCRLIHPSAIEFMCC